MLQQRRSGQRLSNARRCDIASPTCVGPLRVCYAAHLLLLNLVNVVHATAEMQASG